MSDMLMFYKLAMQLAFGCVIMYATGTYGVERGPDERSARHPGKSMRQAYPDRYPSGGLNEFYALDKFTGATKFDKLLTTNAEVVQCVKNAQKQGDKQLFGGYLGPIEAYCVCLHTADVKDICRIQAEILYRAVSINFTAKKRGVGDDERKANLLIAEGPNTRNVRFPCSAIVWNKFSKALIFTSQCGKGAYSPLFLGSDQSAAKSQVIDMMAKQNKARHITEEAVICGILEKAMREGVKDLFKVGGVNLLQLASAMYSNEQLQQEV